MNIVNSINEARKKNITDDVILVEIRKQNPQKEPFFKRAEETGASSTAILNEIIRQNKEEPAVIEKENIPEKPTDETKLWIRIFITLGLVSFCALSFTALYRAFFIPKLRSIDPKVVVKEISIPRSDYPLIKLYSEIDDIQRFAVAVDEELSMNLRRVMREKTENEEVLRLIIEDQRVEDISKIINLEDFFAIFKIEVPVDFFVKIDKSFDIFVYTKEDINSLGFAVKYIKSEAEDREDITWNLMRKWEKDMPTNFSTFFAFWEEEFLVTGDEFSESAHQGTNMPRSYQIRYKEGSNGMGLYYSLTEDRLLLATSMDCIKMLIERYYELTK
jgi:hypothetical protein